MGFRWLFVTPLLGSLAVVPLRATGPPRGPSRVQ